MDNLIKTARTLKNKGKTHIFLGDPLSDGCDKTTVEPGNGFSPGVWTCGVSAWVTVDGRHYTPDLLEDGEVAWGFGGGRGLPPILESAWRAGGAVRVASRLAHLGGEGAQGVDFCRVELTAETKTAGELSIVVRDIGPAGGKIDSMAWSGELRTLTLNQSLKIVVEDSPASCDIVEADGLHDSPMAVLRYPFDLPRGGTMALDFKAVHGFANRQFGGSLPNLHPWEDCSVAQGFDRCQSQWERAVPAKVFSPDGRLEQVWQRECFHILSAMECGQPRIGAVNYPVFWMRDGVIVLRALDLMGRHDLARMGNEGLSSLLFSGGFGAEADGPGEGIWSLVCHSRLTGDTQWLGSVFSAIEKRVEWIEKMVTADKPIRLVGENKIPFYIDTPGINLLCFPAVNGTIHGRMDWHTPDFFINCWAYCGLRLAAEAAELLGQRDKAQRWADMAHRLDESIAAELLPRYGNERDPIVAPYPTDALSGERAAVKEKFAQWYRANRQKPDGSRTPEPLWTYFEAAQSHNALLLGFRDAAWASLEGMTAANSCWDVSAFTEGLPGGNEMLPFGNSGAARGWLDRASAEGGNMPHNWTSAELVNLIRDLFVREEGDGLALGSGVPKQWLTPGARFGVENMPTNLGPVSYIVTVADDGTVNLDYKGPEKYRLDLTHNEDMK
jgi:hypothetical protein